ncbi:Ig-like domain-containing protein [Streptomyces recifensis]|uniref:Ig-like domain-containing protein n=1 Tax=Streptomyces recifensis TaxID=67355 RepID=UPI00111CE3EB|nr:Ig-like domain-containing protein [Streptomyces recifensis]
MAVTIIPSTVAACSNFTALVTGAPTAATSAVFNYDGATPQTLPVVAGGAGPATFTAVGSGVQLVSVSYVDAGGVVVGSDSGTVTVTAAPAGTISTTLSAPGGTTTATTTLTCSAGLTSVNGTLTYTLPGGTTVTAAVVNGVVAPTNLGVALTAGQTVGVSFTSAAGSCVACTFTPITVTVPTTPSCLVLLLPPSGVVVAGQPTTLTALVLCNGLPVSGASVTFSGGGATPVTVTTNASGIATGSLTFPTAGPASVTATVTAANSVCSCTNVSSTPITINVTTQPTCSVVIQPVIGPVVAGQPTTLTALVLCNGLPVSGASVTFSGGGATPVTVTTNASGIATGSLTFPTAGPASVTATVTAANSACSCTNVSSTPITINVTTQPSCLVFLLPPSGPVVAGQPTTLTALVLCNGLPVSGASVTFSGGGATPVTATTNASGIATGSLTFPTAGPASVTATVTAANSACSCANVSSTPITINVTGGGTGGTIQVLPSCWQFNLQAPLPNPFTATLRARVSPAVAGVTVSFFVGGQLVGTAVTDATGTATLNASLNLLQALSGSFTATANVGGTPVQATGPLPPCLPL